MLNRSSFSNQVSSTRSWARCWRIPVDECCIYARPCVALRRLVDSGGIGFEVVDLGVESRHEIDCVETIQLVLHGDREKRPEGIIECRKSQVRRTKFGCTCKEIEEVGRIYSFSEGTRLVSLWFLRSSSASVNAHAGNDMTSSRRV
ncbi:unnamed protein product [Mycena citricolor]|uniref:Uncharacterized protein n=1 Tax=Mycena citricolor TaxID=2018698 RepID=A0AAD2HZ75_9AGAR|nr:unnamed protein product [Mycena citricolor]